MCVSLSLGIVNRVKRIKILYNWNAIERHPAPLARGNKTKTNFIEIPSGPKSLLVGSGALAGRRKNAALLAAHFLLTF